MSKSIMQKRWEIRLMVIQYQADNNVNCFVLDETITAADRVNGVTTSINKIYVPAAKNSYDWPALKYAGKPGKRYDFFNGTGFVEYLPADVINNIYAQLRKHIKRIRK